MYSACQSARIYMLNFRNLLGLCSQTSYTVEATVFLLERAHSNPTFEAFTSPSHPCNSNNDSKPNKQQQQQ